MHDHKNERALLKAIERGNEQSKLELMTTTQAAIAYCTNTKTYCVTSLEIAQAMLFMGNEYGFTRAKSFPHSGIEQMKQTMKANGFKEIV